MIAIVAVLAGIARIPTEKVFYFSYVCSMVRVVKTIYVRVCNRPAQNAMCSMGPNRQSRYFCSFMTCTHLFDVLCMYTVQ
jgi:hypothetical protein